MKNQEDLDTPEIRQGKTKKRYATFTNVNQSFVSGTINLFFTRQQLSGSTDARDKRQTHDLSLIHI